MSDDAMSDTVAYEIVVRRALIADDIRGCRELFDAEYLDEHGPWDPVRPYGYAPHDVHVIARADGAVIAHAGWQRRVIRVGQTEITVAGVGGVLASARARGSGLGRAVMETLAASIRQAGDIAFGYLGCGEAVVPFYTACGWQRIVAAEAYIGADGVAVTQEPGAPLMILPLGLTPERWTAGAIDLRGRAW